MGSEMCIRDRYSISDNDDCEVLIEQATTEFDKEAFKAKMSEIAKANPGNKEAIAQGLEVLVKDYFVQYPDDQNAIMLTVIGWGYEARYRIKPTSETVNKDGARFKSF